MDENESDKVKLDDTEISQQISFHEQNYILSSNT